MHNLMSLRMLKSIGLAYYYQLHSILVNLNQDVGKPVKEYLAIIQLIWTQLDQDQISNDHLRFIKVLIWLHPEYESVKAALLHRNPLPSLDATIQEILFEKKCLDIIPSKQSDVVLPSTYPPNGVTTTFCKNCLGFTDKTDDWHESQSGKIVGAHVTPTSFSFIYLYVYY
ncbi:Zinc finger, CCHC-type [Cucumis melo var. makuwa]|uniref:Zinc finger, CCHC-type n=1 Tax=Cucumis melo var. makuwa TaxID=1194695 RepID=A0A5D3C8Q2_CUCMM|nr:Zinc finger, CCHC-type [Cucumis melo var. makuwa]TYK08221.1 Zinc finger, CCHC-type [Cucumis melo var. makuwa]